MKKTLTYVIATFIFNTAIAAVLTLLMPRIPFQYELIYSQCIGFSVMSINVTLITYMKSGLVRWAVFAFTLPLSVALGLTLAFTMSGMGSWHDEHAWQSMLVGLFFGLIGAIVVLLTERIDTEVKLRELVRVESEKREMEAQLKLLQAQIEPHFLFNTLANVGSLIDSDPSQAKRLLERLNDWLHLALSRTRNDRNTLAEEIDMLENYLHILKIRFSTRLNWHIELPDAARLSVFPPMLLQPLVENAVRHGIEPKLGGGKIDIRVTIENATLRIVVSDSGAGLQSESGAGTGLSNVRARLQTLFGEAGKLVLHSNDEGGVTAMLTLPIQLSEENKL